MRRVLKIFIGLLIIVFGGPAVIKSIQGKINPRWRTVLLILWIIFIIDLILVLRKK